jgi:hypothetical protein
MKRIFILLIGIVLAGSSQAQKWGRRHPVVYAHPRVHVGVAIGAYPGWYGPVYPGPYYPYYMQPHYYHESRLELQIEDIRNDYSDRIWSVRHDKSIPRKERKARIRELKHDRDKAIIDAKRNYYKGRY